MTRKTPRSANGCKVKGADLGPVGKVTGRASTALRNNPFARFSGRAARTRSVTQCPAAPVLCQGALPHRSRPRGCPGAAARLTPSLRPIYVLRAFSPTRFLQGGPREAVHVFKDSVLFSQAGYGLV